MVAVETVALILGSVLGVLLWTLAGGALLLLAALCVPLKVYGSVTGLAFREEEEAVWDGVAGRFGVTWLFGAVAFRGVQEPGKPPHVAARLFGWERPLSLDGSGGRRERRRAASVRPVTKAQARKREAQPAAGGRGRGPGRWRLSAAELRALLPEGVRLLRRVWRASHVRAAGDLTYGFSDPSLTGWCEALRAVVPLPRELRLKPDFWGARLEGWAEVRAKVYPIAVSWIVATTVLRRPVRRIVAAARRARRAGAAAAG